MLFAVSASHCTRPLNSETAASTRIVPASISIMLAVNFTFDADLIVTPPAESVTTLPWRSLTSIEPPPSSSTAVAPCVLMLTGSNSRTDVARAREAGAAAYVTKDRIAAQLIEAIRELAA